MPLLHCKKCMHEWEGRKGSKCDWCGGKGYILQEETQFENFVRYHLKDFVKKWVKEHKQGGE